MRDIAGHSFGRRQGDVGKQKRRPISGPPSPDYFALLSRDSVVDLFDADGRKLELRDLAIGIDGRVRQDIRGGFDICKRNKHHILGNGPVRAHQRLDPTDDHAAAIILGRCVPELCTDIFTWGRSLKTGIPSYISWLRSMISGIQQVVLLMGIIVLRNPERLPFACKRRLENGAQFDCIGKLIIHVRG